MKRDFIPIKVQKGNKELVWQLDITTLNLTELFNLREELINRNSNISVPVLDAILYDKTNAYYKSTDFSKRDREYINKGIKRYKKKHKVRKRLK